MWSSEIPPALRQETEKLKLDRRAKRHVLKAKVKFFSLQVQLSGLETDSAELGKQKEALVEQQSELPEKLEKEEEQRQKRLAKLQAKREELKSEEAASAAKLNDQEEARRQQAEPWQPWTSALKQ
eukprot:g15459.t1